MPPVVNASYDTLNSDIATVSINDRNVEGYCNVTPQQVKTFLVNANLIIEQKANEYNSFPNKRVPIIHRTTQLAEALAEILRYIDLPT